jgi:PilZ domain
MKKKKITPHDTRNWNRYQFFGVADLSSQKEDAIYKTTIANISLSGLGIYSAAPIGKGKRVMITISFVDKNGKMRQDSAAGKVDWQRKFSNLYLIGIIFDEELNTLNQPRLLEHLSWLIDTYHWPQPYRDKRIAIL